MLCLKERLKENFYVYRQLHYKQKWYWVYFSKAMVPKRQDTACWFWLHAFITNQCMKALRRDMILEKQVIWNHQWDPGPNQRLLLEPCCWRRVITICPRRASELTDVTVAMGRGELSHSGESFGKFRIRCPSISDALKSQAGVGPSSVFQSRIWGQRSLVL